jgi:hypothetical protein
MPHFMQWLCSPCPKKVTKAEISQTSHNFLFSCIPPPQNHKVIYSPFSLPFLIGRQAVCIKADALIEICLS